MDAVSASDSDPALSAIIAKPKRGGDMKVTLMWLQSEL
jgi:hypothetical protein